MATDIALDEEDVTIDASDVRVHLKATDLTFGSQTHRSNSNVLRRAMVHSAEDELVLNFGGDYPGGIQVHGPRGLHVHGRLTVGLPPAPHPATGVSPYEAQGPVSNVEVDEGFEIPLNLDTIFDDLARPAPLDVEREIRTLRRAVLRLLARVEQLEGQP